MASIQVIKGPAAIRIGRWWRPVLSGDVWLPRRFKLAVAALRYATKMERAQ